MKQLYTEGNGMEEVREVWREVAGGGGGGGGSKQMARNEC